MKNYAPVVLLFVVAAMIPVFFLFWSASAAPESVVITVERNKLEESLDKMMRKENDPIYARTCEMKLQNLDYHLAMAYIKENKPDAAIGLLKKLISYEEENGGGARRRYRSCRNEARYYEVLEQSYALKQDTVGADRANQHRDKLMVIAQAEKKREELEEGRSVGLKGE